MASLIQTLKENPPAFDQILNPKNYVFCRDLENGNKTKAFFLFRTHDNQTESFTFNTEYEPPHSPPSLNEIKKDYVTNFVMFWLAIYPQDTGNHTVNSPTLGETVSFPQVITLVFESLGLQADS